VSIPGPSTASLNTVGAVWLRVVLALGIRTSAALGDVPALVFADTHGFAGKTLAVAVAAFPGVLLVFVLGKDGGGEADDADEEDGKLHDGSDGKEVEVIGCKRLV
jgi:hypothetical protein